ncbi:MAG: glyoxalase/bleomycin resistance/extradiol dioxygenase family protein [Sphingobacteriales bacterium]|nr:MAG: glyoxalase/bleomycin resistance/extradiol dioxygenase family protein [Sphingobacteriales bacterium]
MSKQIFVNLAVKDLNKSMEFFKQLGYTFNMQFTNEDAACMVISDSIYAMLLKEEFFKTFTTRGLADATQSKEVLIALSEDSKEKVIEHTDKAVAAGATFIKEQDHGFMFYRAYEDLDGHHWEVVWMDPAAVEPQK